MLLPPSASVRVASHLHSHSIAFTYHQHDFRADTVSIFAEACSSPLRQSALNLKSNKTP